MPTSVGVWFQKLCFVQGCVCILWFCLPCLDSSQMFPVSLGSTFYWHEKKNERYSTPKIAGKLFSLRCLNTIVWLGPQFYCLSSAVESHSTSIKTKVGCLPRWAHRFSQISSHLNYKSIWIHESYISQGADWLLEFLLMDFYLRFKVTIKQALKGRLEILNTVAEILLDHFIQCGLLQF